MLALFPVHRPRLGLSFSAEALSVVEIRRPWFAKPRVRRISDRPLLPGLLRPSASELNMADPEVVAHEVRMLKGSAGVAPVAVSLPDRCAQIILCEFETLPPAKADREALLRWRLQKELNASAATLRLAYRVFGGPGSRAGARVPGAGGHRVLVAAIRPDILAQYEQVCAAAGLLPVSVGFATLQLFDLWRSVMTPAEELFFVHRSYEHVAFLAVRGARPVFLRLKPTRCATADLAAALIGTVQFYEDQYPRPSEGTDAGTTPLFLLDGTEGPATESPAAKPVLDPVRWVDVVHPDRQALAIRGLPSVLSSAGWSALASVMAM
ncbi:MAG: hypothetical protein AB1555_06155 [Nitrospirota bacterium]